MKNAADADMKNESLHTQMHKWKGMGTNTG